MGAEWLFHRIRNISAVVTLENSDAEESESRLRYSGRIFVIFLGSPGKCLCTRNMSTGS